MALTEPNDPARRRFLLLSAARASGVVLMLIGMGIMISGAIEPRDLIGGVLFVAGLIESLILPRLLTRRWRSPPAA